MLRILLSCAAGAIVLLASGCTSGEGTLQPVDQVRLQTGEPRVILLYVDGLRPDILEREADAGRLPVIRETFLTGGARVERAIASYPCVTFANAVSMVTGKHPGAHGIFANNWFDREALLTRSYAGTRNRDLVNSDLRDRTLYGLVEGRLSAVIGGSVRRDAHLNYAVGITPAALQAGIAWTLGFQEETDEAMAEAVEQLHTDALALGGWPSVSLIYFPAVDHAGHTFGCDAAEYRTSLAALDHTLGLLFDNLRRIGVFDDSLIVLTSDHGHLPTASKQSFDLHRWLHGDLNQRIIVAKEDDSGQDAVKRRLKYAEANFVLNICGARQASLHVRSGAEWHMRPTARELADLGTTTGERDLATRLVQLPAVDFVVAREGPDACRVTGELGVALIERDALQDPVRYAYTVLRGSDPFGYEGDELASATLDGRARSAAEWLSLTAHLRHPDAVPQLMTCFDTPRSGDLLIFAAPGWDFSPLYRGGHGGLEQEELVVPMYFAGPTIVPGGRVSSARLVDLTPTALEWLQIEPDAELDLDGVSILPALRAPTAQLRAQAALRRASRE